MKTWAIGAILALCACGVAAEVCYSVGTTVTISGHATREDLMTYDGSIEGSWVMRIDPPLCVEDKRNTLEPQGRTLVSRVQLLSVTPPAGVKIVVTGAIRAKDDAQYTMQPTSLRIAEVDHLQP